MTDEPLTELRAALLRPFEPALLRLLSWLNRLVGLFARTS